MRPRISKRGCVRPSVRPSVRNPFFLIGNLAKMSLIFIPDPSSSFFSSSTTWARGRGGGGGGGGRSGCIVVHPELVILHRFPGKILDPCKDKALWLFLVVVVVEFDVLAVDTHAQLSALKPTLTCTDTHTHTHTHQRFYVLKQADGIGVKRWGCARFQKGDHKRWSSEKKRFGGTFIYRFPCFLDLLYTKRFLAFYYWF